MNVPDNVRDILARSTITDTTLALPPEQLDRATYTAVDKVLKAAGGKWNRGKRVHVFDRDPRAALGLAVSEGTITNRKAELQAFYTPPDLADLVAEYADVRHDETVLEPSAGAGALMHAVLRDCNDPGPLAITTVDIDPESPLTNADATPVHHVQHIVGDFLKVAPTLEPFDVVVMNPPFTKGQAVAHVKAALPLAARRLVAIMPPTWQDSTRKADRELVDMLNECDTYEVIPIDAGAFKASGTMVRTVLLVVDK